MNKIINVFFFKKEGEKALDILSVHEAETYLKEGQFTEEVWHLKSERLCIILRMEERNVLLLMLLN